MCGRTCDASVPQVWAALGPTKHVNARIGVLPLRIALLGADQPWIGAFCRRVMELNWYGIKISTCPTQIAPILDELGLPTADILAKAQADSTKTLLRDQTEEARTRGIFVPGRSSLGQRCSGARSVG